MSENRTEVLFLYGKYGNIDWKTLFTTHTHKFFGSLNVTDRQVNLEFVVMRYTWRFLYPDPWYCPEYMYVSRTMHHSTHSYTPGVSLTHLVKSTTPILHDMNTTVFDKPDEFIEPGFRPQHIFLTTCSGKTSEIELEGFIEINLK